MIGVGSESVNCRSESVKSGVVRHMSGARWFGVGGESMNGDGKAFYLPNWGARGCVLERLPFVTDVVKPLLRLGGRHEGRYPRYLARSRITVTRAEFHSELRAFVLTLQGAFTRVVLELIVLLVSSLGGDIR